MSDQNKSTPAANSASLDDILASLEQQVGTQPNPVQPTTNNTSTVSDSLSATPPLSPTLEEASPSPALSLGTDIPLGVDTPATPAPEAIEEIPNSPSLEVPAVAPLPTESLVMQEVTSEPAPSEPPSVAPAIPPLAANQPLPVAEETKSEEPAAPQPVQAAFEIEEKPMASMTQPDTAVPVPPSIEPAQAAQEVAEHPVVTPPSAPPPNPVKAVSNIWNRFIASAAIITVAAIGSVAVYGLMQQNQDIRQQAATDCIIQYSGTSSFTISGNCSGQIQRFNGPTCPTTQTSVGTESVSNTTYSPQPPDGQCQQVDHHFSGKDLDGKIIPPGGVCSCSGGGTPKPVANCGESCQTTADCRNPSTGGFPVECRNNKCQLPLTGPYACPEGQSSGSICSCSAKQQCGERCGPAVGNKTCDPATSECGFIRPYNVCTNGDNPQYQYCLPKTPNNGYSLLRCTQIVAESLVKPDGTQTGLTAADVAAACATPVPTPTPTATPVPTPTPTAPPLVCLNVTKDIAAPKVGDQVRFTCGTVQGATSYEFRYKVVGTATEGTLQSSGTPNLSAPLAISAGGKYRVQCRPCVGNACTEWEAW